MFTYLHFKYASCSTSLTLQVQYLSFYMLDFFKVQSITCKTVASFNWNEMWKQFWPLLLGFLPSLAAEKEYSSLSDAHQFHTGYSSHLSLPQRFIEIDRYSLPMVSQLLHSNEIWIHNLKKCRLTLDSLKLCLIFLNSKLKKYLFFVICNPVCFS